MSLHHGASSLITAIRFCEDHDREATPDLVFNIIRHAGGSVHKAAIEQLTESGALAIEGGVYRLNDGALESAGWRGEPHPPRFQFPGPDRDARDETIRQRRAEWDKRQAEARARVRKDFEEEDRRQQAEDEAIKANIERIIKAGFHAVAKKVHPDVGGTDEEMRRVTDAHTLLRRIVNGRTR